MAITGLDADAGVTEFVVTVLLAKALFVFVASGPAFVRGDHSEQLKEIRLLALSVCASAVCAPPVKLWTYQISTVMPDPAFKAPCVRSWAPMVTLPAPTVSIER